MKHAISNSKRGAVEQHVHFTKHIFRFTRRVHNIYNMFQFCVQIRHSHLVFKRVLHRKVIRCQLKHIQHFRPNDSIDVMNNIYLIQANKMQVKQ